MEKGFCSFCGRALIPLEGYAELKDGGKACSHCVRKLRVMYPLKPFWDNNGMKRAEDPIEKLGSDEFAKCLEDVIEGTEGLRLRYGRHNAVFRVEEVKTEKKELLKPPTYYASGMVIYGCFDPEDRVSLVRKEGKTEFSLSDVRESSPFMLDTVTVEGKGGEPCILVFSGKAIACGPGDLIVRD